MNLVLQSITYVGGGAMTPHTLVIRNYWTREDEQRQRGERRRMIEQMSYRQET